MNELNLLQQTLGADIMRAFSDESVSEIIVNPDSSLIIEDRDDKHFVGKVDPKMTRHSISIMCQIADKYISKESPSATIELPQNAPFFGARAQVKIPPMVKSASMTIRKHLQFKLSLENFLESEVLDSASYELIKNALINYDNILVVGKPKSGKTTLLKAILNSIPKHSNPKDRIIIMEDTAELEIDMEDVENTYTIEDVRSMSDLVKSSVRSRPDRIIVGEVIDGSAYGMLQAWNVGTSGNISTIHANSCEHTPQRLIDLCHMAGNTSAESLIASTIQTIVFIEKDITSPAGRRVTEITELTGYDHQTKQFTFNNKYMRK